MNAAPSRGPQRRHPEVRMGDRFGVREVIAKILGKTNMRPGIEPPKTEARDG